MVGLYLFGLLAGLVVTSLVSRLSPSKDDDLPFVLEMPPYRVPAWGRSCKRRCAVRRIL